MNEQTKIDISENEVAKKLSQAIQCRTVSNDNPELVDWSEFEKLYEKMKAMFPVVHQTMDQERFCEHAWLYRWPGSDKDAKPVVFMAHQDVVAPGNEEEWTHPPFAGDIADGFVWGRGALDMKSQMIAFFEAAELLISSGFQPKGDIYFSLGKDEEITGAKSALTIAQTLKERGLQFDYVLDESLGFWDGQEWGIDRDLAVIGLCEKGYAVISLTAFDQGGHASQPQPAPAQTALGHVAGAAIRVEANPMPGKITYPCDAMMDAIMPYASKEIQDIWEKRSDEPETTINALTTTKRGNAIFRTTFALTQAYGAKSSNILPQEAEMRFNVRPAPWDSMDDILTHMKETIQDESIRVQCEQFIEPSPVSDMTTKAYQTIHAAVEKNFPEAIPVPSIMLAGTDSVHFSGLSDCIIRFSAINCYRELASTVHATNERIRIESLAKAVEFFADLMSQV